MTCEVCNGGGVLFGKLYLYDAEQSFDADHVVRCDTCQMFPGDIEAAQWAAGQQYCGAFVVWAEENEYTLSTADSNIFIRTSVGDAASLQYELLARSIDPDTEAPDILARVEIVEQRIRIQPLVDAILKAGLDERRMT